LNPYIIIGGLAALWYLFGGSGKATPPVKGSITSSYGSRTHPITGALDFHNGVDIGAPNGTLIVSPFPGIAGNRFYNSVGGNQIIIKHDNGLVTGYAHLDASYPYKPGDRVEEGASVGTVGMTGQATAPHLHLTVKNEEGLYLNPEEVFNF